MTEKTQLVDVHAHFLTDRYVSEAQAAGHVHPDGMPGWPTWSAEGHLALMDQWDIGRSVLSISSPGVHFGDDEAGRDLARHVNEAGAATARAHPDRFGHFASLPLPDVEGSLIELAHALDELGSDGVTFETNAGGVYLGAAVHEPLYAELDRRQAVVFVHPTSPPHAEEVSLGYPRPMFEFLFDSTRAVTDLIFNGVLDRYPGIQWVFTHGGGTLPLLADRLQLFHGTVFPDRRSVVEQLREVWFDLAGTPFPRQVPALVAAFGSEHVVYGSDYCWTPAPATTAQVAALDAASAQGDVSWRDLTTANAKRLLGA